ncbi:enoyl-CoA hydratase/isomerase family protein [Actinacidiphila acidipaludis]|uniref:3-hydroxyisobutyryl-CoA hydrolase n=1 Tax=Actinacidiphila acidipaludis TaxID=2873382 RepID=A0ABS7QH23_9ACTN|nr:enoyl-CoA hydratase/isomerase family protein [Streptomyces acidipaludis]MBY8881237.1 enoyl-CoA hydratase/isomerase family protein [Streptomyces acidipaludis]
MDTTAPPVTTRVVAGTGVIALDRPGALNALDLTMVRLMTDALMRWRDDDGVRSVLVVSTSPKAFCAGGDIRAMRDAGMRGDDAAVTAYFSSEYALNALIADYPKPYTALVDGFAMGGGMGISVHGSALVVTERATLAMPETAIGFFPDIGASHFLPRLPGAVGWYLGLTGARISAEAAVECGLATHYVPAADLPSLQAALTGADDPEAVLKRFAAVAPPSELTAHREAIARCFGAPDLAAVGARLAAEREDREWARGTLEVLRRASPMSLRITFEVLRAGAVDGLEGCLARELELSRATAREPDFHEGVRALLVDKDRNPSWSPGEPSVI